MRQSSIYLSMEEDVPAPAEDATFVEISPEEESILVGEVGDTHILINDMVEEVNRVQDTVVGLEDVLVIASDSGGYDPTDVATASLVGAVGDMAVAGTGVPAEEVIPGVAMEDMDQIKNKVKEVWAKIWAHLKSLWQYISKFFTDVKALLANYDKYLANSATVMHNLAQVPAFSLSSFSTNGQTKISAQEAGQRWKDLEDASANLLLNGVKDNKIYLSAARKYVDDITAQRQKPSGAATLGYMNAAKDLLDAVKSTPSAVKKVASSDARTLYTKILPDGYVAFSEPIQKADLSQVFAKGGDASDAMPSLGVMNKLLQIGIHFESGNDHAKGIKVEIQHMDDAAGSTMVRSARKVIQNAIYYIETAQKQQQQMLDGLAKATEHLNSLPAIPSHARIGDSYVSMASKLNTYATNHTVALQSKVIKYMAHQVGHLVNGLKAVTAKKAEPAPEPAAA